VPAWRRPFNKGSIGAADYARGRLPGRTYASKSFPLPVRASRDHGKPARFVWKVFDEDGQDRLDQAAPDIKWTEEIVEETPSGRKQVRVQLAREAGEVREIQIQRVPRAGNSVESLLTLNREGSRRLIDLVKSLDYIPVEGDSEGIRVDDSLIHDLFADPTAFENLYQRDPEKFRRAIEEDASAADLVAIAHRKAIIARFRDLLANPALFAVAREEAGGGPERVWQSFLEANPWILGITLAGQLLTSWNPERLEQVVAGFSVAGAGKRTDALLRTNGAIRSLVFAEIKHHDAPLLGQEYRAGAWAASQELAGGVSQLQQTVYKARHEIGERLRDLDKDGAETGEVTFLVRPRSYLIIGDLAQLRGTGGVNPDKHRSFELHRRNLYEPEIITFDELLARAEWHVSLAEPRS
jgi:hypothetical protein